MGIFNKDTSSHHVSSADTSSDLDLGLGRSFGIEFSQSPASLRCENCGLFLEDEGKAVRAEFPASVNVKVPGSVFGWYHSGCAEFEGVRDIVLSTVAAEREWLRRELAADAEHTEAEKKRRKADKRGPGGISPGAGPGTEHEYVQGPYSGPTPSAPPARGHHQHQQYSPTTGLRGGYYDPRTGQVDFSDMYSSPAPLAPAPVDYLEVRRAEQARSERRKGMGCLIVLVVTIILILTLSIYAHLDWNGII